MEKYVVSHYMSSKLDYNYGTTKEFSVDTFNKSGIVFRGNKADCIKYCKIQALDAITKMIDFDFDSVDYKLESGLYVFESTIRIMDYTDKNKKNFLFYYSKYYVEPYKTWMDD